MAFRYIHQLVYSWHSGTDFETTNYVDMVGRLQLKIIMIKMLLLTCAVLQLLACQSSNETTYYLVDLRDKKIATGPNEYIYRLHKERTREQTDGKIIIIKLPFLEYPQEQIGEWVEGTVVIDFTVNRKGRVIQPIIAKSLDKDLDRASLACIKRWQFEPILKNGEPVDARLRQEFEFRIK